MTRKLRNLLIFTAFSCLISCKEKEEIELKPGAYYAFVYDKYHYGIAKILVLDSVGIHLLVYQNKYRSIPEKLYSDSLQISSMSFSDELSNGYLPLKRDLFLQMKPEFIKMEEVSKEEIDYYRIWKENPVYLDGEFMGKE